MSLEVLGYDAAGYRLEEVLEFTKVSYLYTYFSNPIAEPKIKESPWTLFLTIRKMILSSRDLNYRRAALTILRVSWLS